MAGAPPPRRDSPPALPDELVEDILLRLPPEEPAWILRASLISKAWGCTISSPAFRRRLHEFHRAPPVLGFLHNWGWARTPRFTHTTISSLSLSAPDCESWRALDYRHGRALFLSKEEELLLVWEPITGARRRIPVPPLFESMRSYRNTLLGRVKDMCPGAAVFCAADGCDHRDCHGGPFGLVFVFTNDVPDDDEEERFNIMLTEDGGLGVAEYSNPNLKLWTKETSDGTNAHWVLSRVINLVNLLPFGALHAGSRVEVVGFAEGTNTIFLSMAAGIFTVELQSEKARKVCDSQVLGNLVPVVSFYTPMPRAEYQDMPSSGFSEEAGGEEGEEDEKAVVQPQQLFDKGSNDAIEEGGFVNVRFSHALQTRVPSKGEVALECASMDYGCALLYKAQAMNDPLDDVPNSASNEESVMGTKNKDDAGKPKTAGSNVQDAAPSQKRKSKEGLR